MKKLFAILTIPALLWAEAPSTNSKPTEEETTPKLSPAGQRRIQDNIKVLDQNIKDAQSNLATCDKNLKVLQGEIDELNGLETEHGELKQKLSKYVESAKSQMQKNQQETHKVAKTIKEVEAIPRVEGDNTQRQRLLDKMRQDEIELSRWKGDADAKLKRVNDMFREINTSLGDIAGRKSAIRADITAWNRRKDEYEKLLVHYRQKRAEGEALVKASSKN